MYICIYIRVFGDDILVGNIPRNLRAMCVRVYGSIGLSCPFSLGGNTLYRETNSTESTFYKKGYPIDTFLENTFYREHIR